MVMVPPMGNTDAVVNAKVLIPEASTKDTLVTIKPSFGTNLPQSKALATSVDVEIDTHANMEYGSPVINCPSGNLIE